jgi:tetratricopeptide (TPR) repeat protein
MSQNTEEVPFRTQLRVAVSNFLQKYRTALVGLVAAAVIIVGVLAIWTQVDASTKTAFAAKIEQSQTDFSAWQSETDAAKKATLGKALEIELAEIQKNAPVGYGLDKAWFLQGNYFAADKKWTEAAKAFRTVFDKDSSGYLAPIALVNSAVSLEEAGDAAGALAAYADFDKKFATNAVLAPQVFFTEGRLLEGQKKATEAVAAYKKLVDKFPDSGWTKLGRDRILILSPE